MFSTKHLCEQEISGWLVIINKQTKGIVWTYVTACVQLWATVYSGFIYKNKKKKCWLIIRDTLLLLLFFIYPYYHFLNILTFYNDFRDLFLYSNIGNVPQFSANFLDRYYRSIKYSIVNGVYCFRWHGEYVSLEF